MKIGKLSEGISLLCDEVVVLQDEIKELIQEIKELRIYKNRTEKFKEKVFEILQCGSNGRVIEEIKVLKDIEDDEG